MFNQLLPLGSIVKLEGGTKRLMILGRAMLSDDDLLYDYAGVPYPEGLEAASSYHLFNTGRIETVYTVGFQDAEEAAFKASVQAAIDQKAGGDKVESRT